MEHIPQIYYVDPRDGYIHILARDHDNPFLEQMIANGSLREITEEEALSRARPTASMFSPMVAPIMAAPASAQVGSPPPVTEVVSLQPVTVTEVVSPPPVTEVVSLQPVTVTEVQEAPPAQTPFLVASSAAAFFGTDD
jgi:hypothetical protein